MCGTVHNVSSRDALLQFVGRRTTTAARELRQSKSIVEGIIHHNRRPKKNSAPINVMKNN
jgi:hypothetical protein